MMTDSVTDHNALHSIAFKRDLDLYRQLNPDSSNGESQARYLEVRGLNPSRSSNFEI